MDPAHPQEGLKTASGIPAWCHFSVRLERRGLHKAVKGGRLGYEDEKFSWIYVSKEEKAPPATRFRLHSDPRRINRNITLAVCDSDGKRRELFYKRRDTAYGLRHAARQKHWGDAWNPDGPFAQPEAAEEDPGD
jgi:ribosomal protein RSM22 (predicted rRNA methylase)